jgi:sugar phosphate isomerase/epimerase
MPSVEYCLNASTIRPAPLLDKIRVARAAGFRAVELWNDELSEYVRSGGRLTDVRRATEDAGLAVPTVIALHGWLGTTGAEHAQALDEAKRRMEEAAAVGAPHIIASPPLDAADLSRAGDDYRELLELGREFGVRPAMEYLGFVRSVHTIEQAWRIVEDAAHPDAAIVMDPFHIVRGGGRVQTIAAVPGAKVAIWHWNDIPDTRPVPELTDADRVLPGDGVGPLREIERLIVESGYSGYVSLELFSRALWERPAEEVARIGYEKMQAYFTH